MATLALAAAGAAAGATLLPGGLSLFGVTLSGAAIGAQIGSFAGSTIDQALFGGSGGARHVEGPRLDDLAVTTAGEGNPIPRVYGAARVGGQLIWSLDLEEVAATQTIGGGKGSIASPKSSQTTYAYFGTFALGLCEGPISGIGRIWADGLELDLSGVTLRVYTGDETQQPDALMAAHEGTECPAFRGLAYIVFERLPLAGFGQRIPQFAVEVFRCIGNVNRALRGVVMIPGTGEFVYGGEPVTHVGEDGSTVSENAHTSIAATDWLASLDNLKTVLPNVHSVSLVVSWFASDLRAGHCILRPGVDSPVKETEPLIWRVAGVARGQAYLVSTIGGAASYGGTPSDDVIVSAITELKARGYAVTLNPFVLVDIPEGNGLSDPYGGVEQAPHPWRGRITVDPAPRSTGSADGTASAASQIASFVGTVTAADFAMGSYTGPDEWSYRRQILHYAHLARQAGGVDAFLIGSEMRGLTTVRDEVGAFPFVEALRTLASDARTILGASTKISYAADWSEYFGHHPDDGSGDVLFHLDPLWASPDIDAVAIDLYWPLADWRAYGANMDAQAAVSGSALSYLKSNLAGGEGYDWYYPTEAHRLRQERVPITDGLGKPWVFRFKDLASWWSNPHHDRIAGAEQPLPTAWVPRSKPVWIMEVGCPAVDAGANQPNVFYDPKSAESALPYFSSGAPDELIQRRYLQAVIEGFDAEGAGGVSGLNPHSDVYGGPMVDTDRIHAYAWDARAYPAFPADTSTWSDGDRWRTGHWLTGRLEAVELADLIATILADYGFDAVDTNGLDGIVPGLLVDRIMSAREALQGLELAFFLDAVESAGAIRFQHRGRVPVLTAVTAADLVEQAPGKPLITLTRGQEAELPQVVKVSFRSRAGEYAVEVAEARRTTTRSQRVSQASLGLLLDGAQARAAAESWLHETWVARERAQLVLPPSDLSLEPGDVVVLDPDLGQLRYRITAISDGRWREVEAVAIEPAVFSAGSGGAERIRTAGSVSPGGKARVALLDLPLLRGTEPEGRMYAAASQTPWSGPHIVMASATGTGFDVRAELPFAASMGLLKAPLPAGPTWRFDRSNRIEVQLWAGILSSVTEEALLAGANLAAIVAPDGRTELIQFRHATLVGPRRYVLSDLLRGQAGTESDAADGFEAGAQFVVVDQALGTIELAPDELDRAFEWRVGPAGSEVAGARFTVQARAFRGITRRPYAPVHAVGERTAAGLLIAWTRRTRIGGDSWEPENPPLAEISERYEIDILSSGAIVRTLSATEPRALYTTSDAVADFGAVPTVVDCEIFQIGETWGRGPGCRAAL